MKYPVAYIQGPPGTGKTNTIINAIVTAVPIVRGENLMLVGDPQQLKPVILLDEITNEKLKKRYMVSDEYDYRNNSIYKTYLACDEDKLIILSSRTNLERLHQKDGADDLYELAQYIWSNGTSVVTPKHTASRALGIKPFSSATEEAFLENLNHALENIWLTQSHYVVHKEVAISHVFMNNENYNDLFYNGRFDFVVYEKNGKQENPVLAIELDGKEHFNSDVVINRDKKKNAICSEHNLQLIRVENSYARRYNHIKEILINFFSITH